MEQIEKKIEKKIEVQQKQEPFDSLLQDISQLNFTINLDPLDPFYPAIQERTSRMEELFAKKGQLLEVGQPNRADLEITLVESPRLSTFVMKYSISCPFSFYRSLLTNDKALTSFSSSIAELKVLEAFRPNLTRNTIKFKRLGSFEPRDCFYVKYQNSGKQQHWEVYIHDEKSETSPAYKTCELFCLKTLKETGPKQLSITEYLEIDLQSANPASMLPKLAAEYRNYLNEMQTYIEGNYEQETA